eukprot:CAMPEP_0179136760 /NCGR_PEP_ID=MMETSP0796-20121207/65189_1 /TAXON_ID=73915 /ORGANISM="Pyrodinium bahamense, Strain pbaha01" /LENGTH=63 /DNA_ID=CAMNT_0020835867 /DNA_START=689 /DNA_END=877 /DNA_ORIENTATION=+
MVDLWKAFLLRGQVPLQHLHKLPRNTPPGTSERPAARALLDNALEASGLASECRDATATATPP